MGDTEPLNSDATVFEKIASDLRHYRLKTEMTGQSVGDLVGRNRQAVSNMEHARYGWRLTEEDALILDQYWDTNGHFSWLVRFARTSHDPDWYKEHLDYEAKASQLRIYELSVVPGILQTDQYARAQLRAHQVRDLDGQVAARQKRGAMVFRADPPRIWLLLDEAVLLRPVGGPEVMREQLSVLLSASELPNVVLRVVPLDVGAHVGQEGGFKVMTVKDSEVVYTEASGRGRVITGEEVRSYAQRFDQLGADALSRSASREHIRQVMETMK